MYGTIAGLRAYATARGNSDPTNAGDDVLGAALQRASDYIHYHYEQHITHAVPDATYEAAEYEAAIIELGNPGFFTESYKPSEVTVLTEVRGIKWTPVRPTSDNSAEMMPTSTMIEAMLGQFVSRRLGIGLKVVG